MGVTNSAQSGHIFGLMSCWQNEISGSFCTFYNVRDMPRRPCCRRSCRYRSGPSARGRGMVGGASWAGHRGRSWSLCAMLIAVGKTMQMDGAFLTGKGAFLESAFCFART
jgi:hypothetical protein